MIKTHIKIGFCVNVGVLRWNNSELPNCHNFCIYSVVGLKDTRAASPYLIFSTSWNILIIWAMSPFLKMAQLQDWWLHAVTWRAIIQLIINYIDIVYNILFVHLWQYIHIMGYINLINGNIIKSCNHGWL